MESAERAWHTPRVPAEASTVNDERARMRARAASRRLLEGELAVDPSVPQRRWAYGALGLALVSAFIIYHTVVLLVWNTPSGGLGKKFHRTLLKVTDGRDYFTATSNTQSWAMFAPNPNRTNVFIRVLVEDREGEVWDMKHDIWEVDRHPYVFYDRMGKVNRRIDGKKGYQKSYGAWMCRDWAKTHGGELPEAVRFVKRWTRVPKPREVIARALETGRWGYDPWKLENKQKEQERIVCDKEVEAQLSNEMRARHGLPLLDDDGYKPVRIRTWWDRQEAERRREEAKARAEERKLGLGKRPKASPPASPKAKREPSRVEFVPQTDAAPIRAQPAKPD